MKTERILPVDLYNSVSTPELKLESSLKILYVKEGDDDKLLPLDSGTLAVICTGGSFRCQALHHAYEVTPGQLLLLASDDVTEVKPFHDTGFIGIIIYVSEELLINRQRLVYRDIPSDEVEETRIYLRLIESADRADERDACEGGRIVASGSNHKLTAGKNDRRRAENRKFTLFSTICDLN